MRRLNIKVRVVKVSERRVVATRFGFCANVTNVLVADDTGSIQLPLWNKQIDGISAGDLVQVENASVVVFRGARQLRVGRRGKVSVING
jgi:ssDNA-binding replication factor A large subunit